MESTGRIQIGARSDRNDEHVAGRVLYIGNLCIYINTVYFLSPCGRRRATAENGIFSNKMDEK